MFMSRTKDLALLTRGSMTAAIVCLGAQLIGASLGADSEHAEEAEIGVYPIRLTADGAADPRLAGFAPVLDVGHWHHDMPGLASGAKVLASSGGCSRQIIQYGEFVYGFQCHPEFTRESVTSMIGNLVGELAASCGRPYVQDAAEILGHAFESMNAVVGEAKWARCLSSGTRWGSRSGWRCRPVSGAR